MSPVGKRALETSWKAKQFGTFSSCLQHKKLTRLQTTVSLAPQEREERMKQRTNDFVYRWAFLGQSTIPVIPVVPFVALTWQTPPTRSKRLAAWPAQITLEHGAEPGVGAEERRSGRQKRGAYVLGYLSSGSGMRLPLRHVWFELRWGNLQTKGFPCPKALPYF